MYEIAHTFYTGECFNEKQKKCCVVCYCCSGPRSLNVNERLWASVLQIAQNECIEISILCCFKMSEE